MNCDDKSRLLRFFLLCIPVRLAIVVAAFFLGKKKKQAWYTMLVGLAVLAIGIGLCVFQYLRDTGKREKVGFAGGEVYWNSYVHGSIWIVAALLIFLAPKYAWIPLLIDVILGLSLALKNYFL